MFETKLLELFKLLLGNKYKIVPLSEDNTSKIKSAKIKPTTSKKRKNSVAKTKIAKNRPQANVSDEALALFERDKKLYNHLKTSSVAIEETPELKDIKQKAQVVYDELVCSLNKKADYLEKSAKAAEGKYGDIAKNHDNDDPFRNQILSQYHPSVIREEILRCKKIAADPFYGMAEIIDSRGETQQVYIGKSAFQEDKILISSTWSNMGKAFRHNYRSFLSENNETFYINKKYIFIVKNNKIISVKDDSPR